jgi:hypothetical protein
MDHDDIPDGMNGADDDQSSSVLLGGDIDSETCGRSYNRVEWDLDVTTGQIQVRLLTGCYGGDSIDTTDVEQAAAFITGLAGQFPDAGPALAAEAANLRGLLATPA